MSRCAFAPERLTAEFMAEAWPLLEKHRREVARYQDIELNPDMAVYQAAVNAGIVRLFTARHYFPAPLKEAPDMYMAGQRLVGYALFFVRPNPHYAQSVQAVQDVIFLDKSMRGVDGWQFIKYCDHALAAEGVDVIYHHVKAKHNFGHILERMGYELVDHIYARRVNSGRDSRDAGSLSGFDGVSEPGEPEAEGHAGRSDEAAFGTRPEYAASAHDAD